MYGVKVYVLKWAMIPTKLSFYLFVAISAANILNVIYVLIKSWYDGCFCNPGEITNTYVACHQIKNETIDSSFPPIFRDETHHFHDTTAEKNYDV